MVTTAVDDNAARDLVVAAMYSHAVLNRNNQDQNQSTVAKTRQGEGEPAVWKSASIPAGLSIPLQFRRPDEIQERLGDLRLEDDFLYNLVAVLDCKHDAAPFHCGVDAISQVSLG
jgi:hypothetical protein